MLHLSDTTIKKSLCADGVQRLYYVAGTEPFLIDGCVRTIAAQALGGGRDGLLRFEQKTLCDGAFEELFYSYSMLGGRRVALIEDFAVGSLPAGAAGLLAELFADIPDDLVVILRQIADDRRFAPPKKAMELVDRCAQSAMVLAMAKEGAELERYLALLAKRAGCTLEPDAARALAALCGEDLLAAGSEIEKLAALANYTAITAAHVKALGVRSAETGVYQMLSALENGKTKQALLLLCEMLDDLTEPLSVTAALNTAFVNLYRAKLARAAGKSLQALGDEFGYKKGDRRLAIAFERCGRYTLEKLEAIIGALFELDRRLKSSSVAPRIVLEQKLVEIAALVAA